MILKILEGSRNLSWVEFSRLGAFLGFTCKISNPANNSILDGITITQNSFDHMLFQTSDTLFKGHQQDQKNKEDKDLKAFRHLVDDLCIKLSFFFLRPIDVLKETRNLKESPSKSHSHLPPICKKLMCDFEQLYPSSTFCEVITLVQ